MPPSEANEAFRCGLLEGSNYRVYLSIGCRAFHGGKQPIGKAGRKGHIVQGGSDLTVELLRASELFGGDRIALKRLGGGSQLRQRQIALAGPAGVELLAELVTDVHRWLWRRTKAGGICVS